MDALIGMCSFFCGVLVMFAIHRLVFDHYASEAEETIRELKQQLRDPYTFEVMHTYAKADDVTDLKFNE